jgi:glycosyltransferase involved in cell wall biosynthesis
MISVIIPVYNRENSIAKAVKSVLSQTVNDWELIIIDDCSTDNTYSVISSYNDPRVKIFKLEKNSGAAAARNFGIQQSRGEYISFLDSDDEYEPEFIEQSNKKFQSVSKQVGLIWTGVRYFRQTSAKLFKTEMMWQPAKTDKPYFSFLSDLRIGTNSGITIRRTVFDKAGMFDETLPAAEDTDLFLRIVKCFSFDYISSCLINIHQIENDRLSKRFDKIARAYNVIIPKHLTEIEKHKTLRLKYFYKGMWLNYHLNNKPLARKYFLRIMNDQFYYIKAWIIFLLFEMFGNSLGVKIHISISGMDK